MYGIEEKIISIFYSCIIGIVAIVVRYCAGTFFVPAGIFAFSWFLFTFFPLILLFSVPINSRAILYILISVVVFSLSAISYDWKIAKKINKKKIKDLELFDTKFLRSALIASAFLAVILSIQIMLINGFTLDQIIFDFLQTSGQYAAVRGNDGMEYGLVGMLAILFTYMAPLLAGLGFSTQRTNWFVVMGLLPSILTMIIQSSKIVFLVASSYCYAGMVLSALYFGESKLIKFQSIPRILLVTFLTTAMVLVSFVSRLGDVDFGRLDIIIDPLIFSITSYVLGQIYAFSDFFSYATSYPSISEYKNEFYSYGAYTLNSIYGMLGFGKDFPPGMYEETGWFPGVFQTNIFTFFRGLIYDFGVVGSILFMYIFGLLSHFLAYKLIVKTRPWLEMSFVGFVVVFLVMGYLFSVFVARYVFFVAAIFWILLVANSMMKKIVK
jgi:oligosaccharide repeat unit polymerase